MVSDVEKQMKELREEVSISVTFISVHATKFENELRFNDTFIVIIFIGIKNLLIAGLS